MKWVANIEEICKVIFLTLTPIRKIILRLMNKKRLVTLIIFFVSGMYILFAQSPVKKFDSSMKIGKAGYKLYCNNKSPDKNIASVTPIGFEKEAREFSFEIKGRIAKAEVDDINRDGFPDLIFYIYNNDSIPKGNVIGICSEKNETVSGIIFPDILDDPKLRIGYKGNDVFFLMEGNLVRRFPVYPTEGKPAENIMRQIQYMVIPGERGGYKFKAARSYEFAKQ